MQAAGSIASPRVGRGPVIVPLPKTQEDVISLRRLGSDRFEATQRSGGCACRDMTESEQAASDASTMTLEGAIAKLTLHSDLDDGGMAILAAATTLRDSTGRGRKDALHKMCRAWGVDRQEKIDGRW